MRRRGAECGQGRGRAAQGWVREAAQDCRRPRSPPLCATHPAPAPSAYYPAHLALPRQAHGCHQLRHRLAPGQHRGAQQVLGDVADAADGLAVVVYGRAGVWASACMGSSGGRQQVAVAGQRRRARQDPGGWAGSRQNLPLTRLHPPENRSKHATTRSPTWNRATSSSAATLIHSMHCTDATNDSATFRRCRRAPSRCHNRAPPLPPPRSQPSGPALLPPALGDSGLPPGAAAAAVAVTTTATVPPGCPPAPPPAAAPAGGTASSSSASMPSAASAQASRKAGALRWRG